MNLTLTLAMAANMNHMQGVLQLTSEETKRLAPTVHHNADPDPAYPVYESQNT